MKLKEDDEAEEDKVDNTTEGEGSTQYK